MELGDDFDKVAHGARELSITFKHGFIHNTHFFAAMLQVDCAAREFLVSIDTNEVMEWLEKLYPQKQEVDANMLSLPLTVHAERNVRHGNKISLKLGKLNMDSIDLLLSIISYGNEIADLFKKKGVTFNTVIKRLTSTPFERFTPYFDVGHTKRLLKPAFSFVFKRPIPDESKIQEAYNDAYDLFVYERYGLCIEICDLALQYSLAEFNSFKILKAYALIRQRAFDLCIPILQELYAVSPESIDYALSLGNCYDETRQFEKSRAILDTLLKQDEQLDIVNNNMGFSLLLQEKYAESVPYFEKAIELNPLFAFPWDNLGFSKYKLGYREEALSLIEKSLELDKGNSYAYKFKGVIYMESGEKEKASECFNTALIFGYTSEYGNEVIDLIDKMNSLE